MTVKLVPQDIAALAQINANFPRYVAYLQAERDEAVQFMVNALDPAVIHRAQGKVAFLDEQIKLLVGAHKLLTP